MMRAMNFSQINFGLFALKIYGALLSLGFALASWYYYHLLPKKGLSTDFFLHHYWRWLLGGILLGRLVAVLFEPGIFERFGGVAFFAFWDGEINLWGGALGFLLTMYIDLRKEKQVMAPWLDAGVLPFLVLVMVADWAAFLTGRVHGTETSLPWGIQYETFGVEILNPVHPITLYAFIGHLLLWWWARRHENTWKTFPGVFAAKATLYLLLIDFFIQFLRGNPLWVFAGFDLNQYFSAVAIFALLYWLYGGKMLEKSVRC